MIERPILFSAPMIKAILADHKTQTRRIVKPQPDVVTTDGTPGRFTPDDARKGRIAEVTRCPYGKPGDRLWVRETWRVARQHDNKAPSLLPYDRGLTTFYSAGGSRAHDSGGSYVNDDVYPTALPDWADKLRPSIFMPRAASRITLELTGVRVERLQDITEADAIAEGIPPFKPSPSKIPRMQYATLWDKINAKRAPWESNPWVWVIQFKRIGR